MATNTASNSAENSSAPSDDVSQLWLAAVEQYRSTTGTDPKVSLELGQPRTYEDMLNFIDAEDDRFINWRDEDGKFSKVAKFRAVLKDTLGPINNIGQIVSDVVSKVYPPSSTIFAAVFFLIKAAQTVSADYDTIFSFFSDLKVYLERLDILKGHLASTTQLRRCTMEIFTSVLIMCGLTEKSMKSRVGRYLKAVVRGRDKQIQEAYKNFTRAVDQMTAIISVDSLVIVEDTHNLALQGIQMSKQTDESVKDLTQKVDATNKMVNNLIDNMKHEPQRVVDTSLVDAEDMVKVDAIYQPLRSCEIHLQRMTRSRLPGTGEWVPEEEAFKEWWDEYKPYLWISGGPGSGKSFIAAFLINYMKQKAAQATEPSVGYFFFNGDEKEARSVTTALRTMISQISEADGLFREFALIEGNFLNGPPQATVDQLWSTMFVKHYDKDQDKRLVLVFDGIDEINESELDEFLGLLADVEREQLKIQVLLLGRPEMDSSIDLLSEGQIPTIFLTEYNCSSDISQYIYHSLFVQPIPNIARFSKPLRDEISTALNNKVQGMFLYVDLMIQELSNLSAAEVSEALEELPNGLVEMYDRIFQRLEQTIDEDELKILKELICWTVFAEQPLSISELKAIVTIELQNSSNGLDIIVLIRDHCSSLLMLVVRDPLNLEDIGVFDDDQNEDNANERSGPEVSNTENESQTQARYELQCHVRVRHSSVSDYVRSQHTETKSLFSSNQAISRIALTCLEVLQYQLGAASQLFSYAARSWVAHLTSLNALNIKDDNLIDSVVECLHQIFTNDEPLLALMKYYRSEPTQDLPFRNATTTHHPDCDMIVHLLQEATSLTASTRQWALEIIAIPSQLFLLWARLSLVQLYGYDAFLDPLSFFRHAWVCLQHADIPLGTRSQQLKQLNVLDQSQIVCSVAKRFFGLDKPAIAFLTISEILFKEDFVPEALTEAEDGLEMSDDDRDKALLQNMQGTIYYSLGERVKGIQLLKESFLQLDIDDLLVSNLAVCQFADGNYSDAAGSFLTMFRRAIWKVNIETNPLPRRHLVYLQTCLKRIRYYSGMIDLLEEWPQNVRDTMLQTTIDDEQHFQTNFCVATRMTNRFNTLVMSYRNLILDNSKLGTSSWYKHRLAVLYLRYINMPDKALSLWKEILLNDKSFIEINTRRSYNFKTRVFQDVATFLYDRVVYQDGDIQQDALELLVRLANMRIPTYQVQEFTTPSSPGDILRITLGGVFMRIGRHEAAQVILDEQFKTRLGFLRDATGENDPAALAQLGFILGHVGMVDTAGVSMTLMLSLLGQTLLLHDKELDSRAPNFQKVLDEAARNSGLEQDLGLQVSISCDGDCDMQEQTSWKVPLNVCLVCGASFCDVCYAVIAAGGTLATIQTCNRLHTHVRCPVEGWGGIENGIITIGSNKTSFHDWLASMEGEWKAAWTVPTVR